MKRYIVMPEAWLTRSMIENVSAVNAKFIRIKYADSSNTKYFIFKLVDIYDDMFTGHRKLNKTELNVVIVKIKSDSIVSNDYYHVKGRT